MTDDAGQPIDLAGLVRDREERDLLAKQAGAELLRRVLLTPDEQLPEGVREAKGKLLTTNKEGST